MSLKLWYMSLYKKVGGFIIFYCFEIEVIFIYIGIYFLGLRDIYKLFISIEFLRVCFVIF